ncbi:MAG: RNB domain-containing ribonuclease [Planctomycetes bacterium]|nr:RNB domain-containing ribonuclease [Planctomycetota bacterium]
MPQQVPSDVIAFPRRERVVLAVVLSENPGPGGVARLTVLAEDGARFPLPADQVFARFPGLLDQTAAGPAPQRLGKLRAGASTPLSWSKAIAGAPAGATLTFDELAVAAGARTSNERLRVALALGASEPWLRRTGPTWFVVPAEEARAKVAAAEAARRAEREDAAIAEWWPRRESSLPPDGAKGAVEAIREYAIRGDAPGCTTPVSDRGRTLAARFDMVEPDQVLDALAACGLLDPATNPAPWRAALAGGFAQDATDEARRAAAAPCASSGREDFTDLHTVAVDDEETTEVDDAISVRRVPGGVEILIHIADTAAVVPVGSPLDLVLRARATSLYVPDGAVTMLPGVLVEDRVSLDAGVVRAAVTGVFVVAPDGAVVSSRFVRSLVRVTNRLTYDATRDSSVLAATPADAAALVAAAEALRAARIRDGAIVLNLPSMKVRAEDGAPHLEVRHQDTAGDSVVAEAAVLYNAEAGRLFASRDVAALFRTQEAPRGAAPDATDPLFPVLVRRRFAPSHVRVEPSRHHGVGRDAYAQCTSPMRRYADLVNQRQLLAVAAGEPPPYLPAALETIAAEISERERAVRRAADDRMWHWIALDVKRRGVTSFEGVLTRAPRRGMGGVWVPDLLQELPLRAPDRWRAPPEGTRAVWPVGRVSPWRSRIELSPPPEEKT